MTSLEAAQVAVQSPAADAAAGTAETAYSIRYFFSWHREAFRNLAEWTGQNGYHLLSGLIQLAIIIVFCFLLLFLIRKVLVPWVKKLHKNLSQEIMAVSSPVVWLVFWFGFSHTVDTIPFSEEVHSKLDSFFYICFILTGQSIFLHALQCTVSQLIVWFKRKDPENYSMNKLMLDLAQSIIRLVIWTWAVFFILQEVLHFKVTHLVASAGILGLAVAFAAKDTIANIFGAFSVLGCKMFKVGDWIKAGSTEGVVNQIGIRSTRIRSFSDGRLIDIPNHIVADTQIENFNTRLYWREHFCFGLVYRTTPEQMLLAKKILCEIGNDFAHLMAENKPPQFDFMLFDQSSLNLDGYVWFKASDFFTMRRSRGIFNEEVLKRFSAAGLELAYPTTTVVLEPEAKQ